MDDLVKRANKALERVTPGPWRVVIDDDGNPLSGRPGVFAPEDCDCEIVHWDGFVQEYWRSARGDREIHANASFIAEARELVPELVAEIERLREALRERGAVIRALIEADERASGEGE